MRFSGKVFPIADSPAPLRRMTLKGKARRRAFALAGAALLISAGQPVWAKGAGPTTAGAQGGPSQPQKPALLVVISVDQFSANLFEKYQPSFSGGLATLGSGIVYPSGYQAHAATETCPGHATILTGRHPKSTGIVANRWYDRASGANRYCVAVPGESDKDARGPQQMRGDTLGAWLKQAHPGARVFTVSGKDRAAIMLAGRGADGVYWWADGKGFTTSSFAGPAGPAVTAPAARFNQAFWQRWQQGSQPLWPAVPSRCAALAVSHRYGDLTLSGKAPPDLARDLAALRRPGAEKAAAAEMRASPFLDEAILDFAWQTIEDNRLGRNTQPDLIGISLSATDYIGHRYGSGGAEMCAQMAALDSALARFLARLESLKRPYLVVLTADHGAVDAAERENLVRPPAVRIDTEQFLEDMNAAVSARLRLAYAPLVADGPQELYILPGPNGTGATRTAAEQKEAIRKATVDWLRQRPEVKAVYTAAEVEAATPPAGTPPDRLTVAQQMNLSFDRARSGDLFVVFPERASFGIPHEPGDMISGHGSVWGYDHRVPILFWWPGITPETRTRALDTVDIAPTLAAFIGVPTPKVDGGCVQLITQGGAPASACRSE